MSTNKPAKNVDIHELRERLLQSHWPKCNELAQLILERGGEEVRSALVAGLGARRHHIRTAAIKALAQLGDPSVIAAIEKHLTDPAHETRVAATEAIQQLRK